MAPRRGWRSAVAGLMLTLEAMDQTIVGIALPRIIGELQGADHYAWPTIAYLFASTAVIPIASKLADRFEPKWFLVAGTVDFVLGSALAGGARTMDQLAAFRAVQGMGAGMGIAVAFMVPRDLVPPRVRARWQALLTLVFGIATAAGPTIGGWLADHGPLVAEAARWRWIFYVNVPLGLIALAGLALWLPARVSGPESAPANDMQPILRRGTWRSMP